MEKEILIKVEKKLKRSIYYMHLPFCILLIVLFLFIFIVVPILENSSIFKIDLSLEVLFNLIGLPALLALEYFVLREAFPVLRQQKILKVNENGFYSYYNNNLITWDIISEIYLCKFRNTKYKKNIFFNYIDLKITLKDDVSDETKKLLELTENEIYMTFQIWMPANRRQEICTSLSIGEFRHKLLILFEDEIKYNNIMVIAAN